MFYLKDDNGNKSQTTTLVWVGITVAAIKLLVGGSKLFGMEFGEFSGTDFGIAVAPFLALLAHKRQVNAKEKKPQQ